MCKYLNARCSFLSLVKRFKFSNHPLPRRVNTLNSWHVCYLEEDKEIFPNVSAKQFYLFIKICFLIEQLQIQDFHSPHQMI